MSQLEELQGAIKSLRLGLRQSFVLKEQCAVIGEALDCLRSDIEENTDLYKEGDKLTFSFTTFLNRFLRFTRLNLKVTETFPVGLGDLRRARSLANINSVRKQLNVFASELQMTLMTSSVGTRIGSKVARLLSGEGLANVYESDSRKLPEQFKKVFTGLQKAFPQEEYVNHVNKVFIQKLPSNPTMETYDAHELRRFSYGCEWKLLGKTATAPTPYTDLKFLDSPDKPFKKGRFGKIFLGTLGGPLRVCIQEISKTQLETLSSDGRVELYFNLKTSQAKTHENVIKVLGVTMHDGNLYVSMEKVDLSLKDLLHGHGNQERRLFSAADVLAVFLSMSKALEFLHKDGIIHGDVRPDNIYFSRKAAGGTRGSFTEAGGSHSEGCVQLAMFSYGLNLKELHWSTWTEEALVYQAPEVLSEKRFSSASDIYSLAICLWEITQDDRTPFDDFTRSNDDLIDHVKNHGRPKFSDDEREPTWLVDLTNISWSEDPWHRPSASRLRLLFEQIITKKKIDEKKIKGFINQTLKRRQEEAKRVQQNLDLLNGAPSKAATDTQSMAKSVLSQPQSFTGSARPLPPLQPSGAVPSPFETPMSPLPQAGYGAGYDAPMSPQPQTGYGDGYDSPMSPQPMTTASSPEPALPRRPLPPLQQMNSGPGSYASYGSDPQANGAPLQRVNTLDRINEEEDRRFRKENRQQTLQEVPYNGDQESFGADGNFGPDGISAEQMKRELSDFYAQYDPDMLSQLDPVVQYYMEHGLIQLNPRLEESFGVGLPRFQKPALNVGLTNYNNQNGLPMPMENFAPPSSPDNRNKAPKQGVGRFTMFGRKKKNKGEPDQRNTQMPGGGNLLAFDNGDVPPLPARNLPPPGL